jgi:hypothetical protein
MKYHETPRSFKACVLSWGHVSGTFDQKCIGVGKVHKTCLKVGGVGWEWPRVFGMLWNTSETFEVVLKCSESNIEVQRRPRVFGVCLRKCEQWLCPYKVSCDVVSELGPVGGPINLPLTEILTVPVSSTKCAKSCANHEVVLKFL